MNAYHFFLTFSIVELRFHRNLACGEKTYSDCSNVASFCGYIRTWIISLRPRFHQQRFGRSWEEKNERSNGKDEEGENQLDGIP